MSAPSLGGEGGVLSPPISVLGGGSDWFYPVAHSSAAPSRPAPLSRSVLLSELALAEMSLHALYMHEVRDQAEGTWGPVRSPPTHSLSLTTLPSFYLPIPASPATNVRPLCSAAFGTNRSLLYYSRPLPCPKGMGGQSAGGHPTAYLLFPSALPSQGPNPSAFNIRAGGTPYTQLGLRCTFCVGCPEPPSLQGHTGSGRGVQVLCPVSWYSISPAPLRYARPGLFARSLRRGIGRDATAAAREELAGAGPVFVLPSSV